MQVIREVLNLYEAHDDATNNEISFDISPAPGGCFIVRAYPRVGTLDYEGVCFVLPKVEEGEYEICTLIVRRMANFIPDAIQEIRRKIKPKRLTATFEKRKLPFYRRYLRKYGIDFFTLKRVIKTYNGVSGDFFYVELMQPKR